MTEMISGAAVQPSELEQDVLRAIVEIKEEDWLQSRHREQPKTDFDRTSPEYFDRAMEGVDAAFGLVTETPPESYEELRTLVESRSNSGCGISNEIDHFMGLVALDPDPDEIARSLPHDVPHKSLVFVLPKFVRGEE